MALWGATGASSARGKSVLATKREGARIATVGHGAQSLNGVRGKVVQAEGRVLEIAAF
jgi:hypothetical protein